MKLALIAAAVALIAFPAQSKPVSESDIAQHIGLTVVHLAACKPGAGMHLAAVDELKTLAGNFGMEAAAFDTEYNNAEAYVEANFSPSERSVKFSDANCQAVLDEDINAINDLVWKYQQDR